MTSNLERRVLQHRGKFLPGFTARYNVNRLVHYETFGNVVGAITREKQIKSWGRMKKIALIESANRDWKDLSEMWHNIDGLWLGSAARDRARFLRQVYPEVLRCAQDRSQRKGERASE